MTKKQPEQLVKLDQSVSNIFGQSPVFDLDDTQVDPKAIEYLRGVRSEALKTLATSQLTDVSQRCVPIVKHSASMYDDDGDLYADARVSMITPGEQQMKHSIYDTDSLKVIMGESSATSVTATTRVGNLTKERAVSHLRWFDGLRSCILDKAIATQEYNDKTINLLLLYLREYLVKHYPVKKGILAHLVNLLRDLDVSQQQRQQEQQVEEEAWILDESWVTPTLKRLGSVRLRTVEDIKICLRGDYSSCKKKLTGFREWSQFIRENEPLHSMFCTSLSTTDDLCLLLNFFSHTWLQWMTKEDVMAKHLAMWLFYILAHLPSNLAATHVSTLRELAKRCLGMLKTGTVILLYPSTEMKILSTDPVPEGLGLLQLVVVVVSVRYGQLDLLGYE